jgi:hypothetical protein
MIERWPRAPVLRSMALRGDGAQRLLGKAEVDALHLEQPMILLDQGVRPARLLAPLYGPDRFRRSDP